LSSDQLRVVAEVAESSGAAGLIATNTTVSRPDLKSAHGGQAGGLSGRPLADLATSVLVQLRDSTSLPVVSVGGIFTAGDVLDRLRAGASLVQLYTSFVYQGPGLLRSIKQTLLARMEADGLADLQALVGASR
ncbi:MAG TPA: nitronate monooxygenase, partial [Trueperaceae bacterium]|nr:nitronate monooxygenase [Trueperaceae bacterium]